MNKNDSNYKRISLIYGFTRGFRFVFVLAVIFSMINTITFALVPQIVRFTVDSVIGTSEFNLPEFLVKFLENLGGREYLINNLYICGLGVLITTTISGICNFLSRKNLSKSSEGFMKNMRNKLYSHISKLPLSWHIKHQTGDIIQRCTSDTETLKRFTAVQLYEVFKVSFLIFFTMILMFSMNKTLALVSLAFVPISLIYTYIFFGKISKKFLIADEKEGELSNVVQENLTGVRVVRAFGRQAYELKRFDVKNDEFAHEWIKMGKTNGFYWGGGDMITSIQILAVVIMSTIFAIDGKITTGEFLAFVAYNASLTWPIRTLGRVLVDMSKAFVSVDRLAYILNAKEEKDIKKAIKPNMIGDIEFKNVSFSYNENIKVLKNLNFTIKKGETFGILGGTGSGKSTLVHLINRLFEMDENSDIIIAGNSVKKIKLSHLRENIGLVLQEPFLFSKSILDNIAITNSSLGLKEVKEVAKIASINDSIESFKDGYQTIIGERGVTLSGGQKQRIAISRAIVQKTPIMIFDDSLSAVDTETDVKIRKSLKENLENCTVILISHRITTLMEADKIMVLENGEIADIGTHGELLSRAGIYKEIYEIQMSDSE